MPLNKIELIIELIYRNYCFSKLGCKRCKAKNEDTVPSRYDVKDDSYCLINKVCVFDFIGMDMYCVNCYCFDKTNNKCLLLKNQYGDRYPVSRHRFYGYWKVTLNERSI